MTSDQARKDGAHAPKPQIQLRDLDPVQTAADFAAAHADDVRAFNAAQKALDDSILSMDESNTWQSIVRLSLLAHFKEVTTAAFHELAMRRPAAAKILVRASLETTYQLVALKADEGNFDKLSYKSVAARLSSIKKWQKSVADDAMKAKATQPIADLEAYLESETAHRLTTIFELAKLAGMEHDYRTDYARLSNFTHADLETILRDRLQIDEPNDQFNVSFDNLNFDATDVAALLVFQHICVLESLESTAAVPALGAYLDLVAGKTSSRT